MALSSFSQAGFYDIGGHSFYFTLLTSHFCLFIDNSPFQKNPLCALNFLFAVLISAAIPSVIIYLAPSISFHYEILVGLIIAFFSSSVVTLNLQRLININVDF